jgi:hypothetical protein
VPVVQLFLAGGEMQEVQVHLLTSQALVVVVVLLQVQVLQQAQAVMAELQYRRQCRQVQQLLGAVAVEAAGLADLAV